MRSRPFYRIGQIEILRSRFDSAVRFWRSPKELSLKERWLSAALDKFGASLMVRDEEAKGSLRLSGAEAQGFRP